MSAAARDHRRPQHRIQVEPLVPRRMQAVEEVQPRARACRELRVVAQLLLEPHLQCRVLRQHLARDLLGHVRLHVLLALEGVVELAPGGKGSAERRVGKEGGSSCGSRWWRGHKKKKKYTKRNKI